MESVAFAAGDKGTRYRELLPQLASLFEGEPDLIANLANATAALKGCIAKASWVGFYLVKPQPKSSEPASDAELVLGPFQGNVACVRIAWGKGVCGTTAKEGRTIVVPDVDKFAGHIACDAGSRSEIVLPIWAGPPGVQRLVAVLDIDSYELAAFDDIDQAHLKQVADLIGTLRW